jgi:hypothetical protein
MNLEELRQVAITSVKKYAMKLEVDDREIYVHVCKPDKTPLLNNLYNAYAGCAQTSLVPDVAIVFNEDVLKIVSDSSEPDEMQRAFVDAVAGHEVAHIIPFKHRRLRTAVIIAGGIGDGSDIHRMGMRKAGCVEAEELISARLQEKLSIYRLMNEVELSGFGRASPGGDYQAP